MSAMRKKTLYELVQERAEQNLKQSKIDTSAYTDKPMKSSNNSSIKAKVDSIYKKQNEDDIFTRVRARAENILNDAKNLSENFILGIGKSGKSSLSYIEEISNQNFNSYNMRNKQISKMNKDKDFNKSVLNGSNTLSKGLPTKENLRLQNNKISTDNAQKIKLQESKQMVSPITDYVNELIEKDEQKIQENIENSQTKIGKKVSELTPSIGQSVAGMAVSAINPALGLSFWQTSAGGDYTREGKNKGLNNKQALLYGSIMGAMESATEAVGEKLTTGVGKAVFKDGAKEGLKAFGLDVAENFFEEAIMEPIQESVMKATGGQADWSNISQRMLESGINGALTSVIMGGASAGIGKAKKLITKIENNQQINQKEITDTLKEINNSEEVDIEKILVDSFKFTAQDLMKNTDVQKNVNTKLENIAEQLTTSEANNFLASKQNILNEEDNTKEQDTIENKRLLNNNQQTNQTDNKIAENQTLEQIEDIKQNLGKVLQKDKYKDNGKANNFFKSAIENDIDISNEKVEALFDLPNARGVETKFDTEAFKNIDGNINENINALYITDREGKRSIIYNPKAYSETVIEKNTIHETFHDMAGTKEAQEITDFVYNKMKDNTDFQEAYDTLREMYSNVKDSDGNILYNKNSQEFENMVKEEAVADYLGTNLGTQEYINELVNGKESRNIAQKIYDAIVNFLDKVTGYKSEEAYLRGLKDKFEKAFKLEYENREIVSKFSINSNFKSDYDTWNKVDRQGSFVIGRTSEALKSIGLNDYDIVMDKSKILKIKNKHPEMTDDIIKSIPEILENPTLILKSQSQNESAQKRNVIFGEINDSKDNPVLVALELNPVENKNNIDKIYKVASAYGKENTAVIQKWLNSKENILYIDNKKNRTMNWLNGLGLQLPVPNNISSSINSITNSNEDVNTTRYSMQEDKRNTLVQDNQGKKLSKEQQEYFKDSKAIDEKGNLVNVYHTTTDRVPQFNEFNPVGTRGYRFGEQVVNYFTDSQEMSGSYANQSYKEANTQKITTDKEVKDYLSNLDSKYFNFILKSYDDGSYRIERNPNLSKNSFYSNLQEELNNLKLKDKETYTKLIDRALILNNPYDLFEGTKKSKLDDFLYNFDNKYGEYTAGETARNILEYINNQYEDIKFENKDDLYRNLMQKMQQKFPRTVGTNNIQYQGYVNLQNPYIIDAEGRNWNSVKLKQNEKSLENLSKISSLQRKEISNLFQEEKAKSDDVNRKYTSSRQVLEKLGEIDNSIYSWFDFLTFKEDSDTERVEAFLNLVEDTKGVNRQEIFDHIYKQELTKDQKAIISRYGNNIIRDSSNIKTIKELYDNMDYYSKTEKFKHNSLKENFKRKIKEAFSDEISIDLNELYQLAERNFSNDVIDELYSQKQTTNDVVKQVIEMNKNGANYDGLIIKNTIDYGGYSTTQKPANLYVTFDSNQFKANDNLTPTTDKDIRYSQSTTNKWQEYLEKHKINKDGTRTTLGEIKLPQKKIKMPTVQESQYQDIINNAKYIPKKEKVNLLSELDGVEKNIKSLKDFKSIVEEMDNTYKQIDDDLLKKQTYNTGNKEIYQSYLKETSKYDTKAIDKALKISPANSQGRRTKEQWINIAKQIGTEISNKSNREIQEIAFRSWQDLRPNSKESLNRQGNKYVDFNSDNWVNTIYDQVEQVRTKFSISEDNKKNIILPGSKKIESNRVELPTNPDIYKDEDVRAFKYATDNIGNIKEDSNFAPPEPSDNELPDTTLYIRDKRSKNKLSKKEILDSFTQQFVNKGHYIDKLAKDTGNKELTYKYDRTLSTFNEAQYSIGEEQVNSKGEVVGESLLEIFKPIEEAKLEKSFEDYLLNKHNIARTITGKSIYGDDVSAPQSKKIVEKYEAKYPQFKEWSEKVSKYNKNTLKDMADTGMISEDTYKNLRTLYGDYVPTYRDIVDEKIIFDDNSVGGNILGKATKSNKKILSPKESMAEQTLAVKKAIRMNELGVELYKTLGKDTKVFEGIDFDATAIQTLGGDVIQKAQDGMNTFTIFIDGKSTQFKISDELYTAFTKDTIELRIKNNKGLNALLTPVEKLSKAQRNLLTTYSIGFAFNNPIKDIQDAVFNTKYNVTQFGKNYIKSLYQIGTNGNIYKQYIRDGGASNTYFDYNKGLLPQRGPTAKIKKIIEKVQTLNEVLEMTPRLAEYMSTIENGGTKSEALYNAAEITTNFKRGGEITKAMNKYGANFLNASVQGLDKQIRNITGANGIKGYAQLITRATILGIAPAIINHLVLSGDDDNEYYEDLPDYIKDSYYLIPKGTNGEFYRIPKGRVIATLGTTARNITETIQGKKNTVNAIESSLESLRDNLAPNNPLKDNLVAPILQAKNNKAWYDGEIESTRLKKLPVAERTDEKTDELSNKLSEALQSNSLTKYIADKLGISPKKLNYVIDQYSGGIGDVLLPMATPYAEDNILEDKFTTDSVLKNKKVEEFYTALQNAEISKNSEYATDTDKLQYKYLSEVSKEVSDLYTEKRKIQNSNLTDKEKKEKSRNIQKQVNQIVKETLSTLDEAKITNSTANFNGTQYYKDEKNTWKTIKEEDVPKGLSTETYADYKNKIAVANDKKKKEKNDKDVILTQKEKVSILKSTTYSDKEKKEIYSNILGKSDYDYKYLSKLENIDIEAYLDYKVQNIKSEEDISSNIVGKTISGSKKANLINYLNSSNLSTLDKVYILGKSNKLDKNQRNIIDNAVNSSNLTNEEKKEFYKGLSSSNIEELKDGTIRWK